MDLDCWFMAVAERGTAMTASVTREIAATPGVIWAVVSDITRMGQWSSECYDCQWDSDHEPGVGATFTGHNRLGDKEWSNHATVVEWSPPEQLVWEVRLAGQARDLFGDDPFARWEFSIAQKDAGSLLTQTTEDLRSDKLVAASLAFLPDVPDRRQRNLDMMATTLAAIAEACET